MKIEVIPAGEPCERRKCVSKLFLCRGALYYNDPDKAMHLAGPGRGVAWADVVEPVYLRVDE